MDFDGARLIGSSDDADPDQFAVVAALIDAGSNVTVRRATSGGYRSRVDRGDPRRASKLKVEYYEVGGWSEMRFDIQPRRSRQ